MIKSFRFGDSYRISELCELVLWFASVRVQIGLSWNWPSLITRKLNIEFWRLIILGNWENVVREIWMIGSRPISFIDLWFLLKWKSVEKSIFLGLFLRYFRPGIFSSLSKELLNCSAFDRLGFSITTAVHWYIGNIGTRSTDDSLKVSNTSHQTLVTCKKYCQGRWPRQMYISILSWIYLHTTSI